MIYDYGKNNHVEWTPDVHKQFLQLLEAAKLFDQVAGQPDCEDPSKAKWLQEVKTQVDQQPKE
jgi:hypothetical protein